MHLHTCALRNQSSVALITGMKNSAKDFRNLLYQIKIGTHALAPSPSVSFIQALIE